MLRSPALLVVALWISGTCFADDPAADVAAIGRAKRLREAAALLRDSGHAELADELIHDAEQLIQPALRLLADKQADLAQLTQEIAELERKLGRPSEIAIRVRMLSMPLENWRTLKQAAAQGRSARPAVVNDDWLARLAALEAKNTVSRHAETTLTTRDGNAARLDNGGEFPVPAPDQNGAVAIQWREFGNRLFVLPIMLGLDRIRLQLTMEHSARDMEHAVEFNGTKVPGLNKRKIHADCTSQLGETSLVYEFELDDEVVFGLVTPVRVP